MHDPQLALARLIAVEEIRDLIFEYTNLLDAGNLEGMAQLFAHSAFGTADRRGGLLGELSHGADSVLQQYRDFTRIHPDLGTPVQVKMTGFGNRDAGEPAPEFRDERPDDASLSFQRVDVAQQHVECERGYVHLRG